MPNGLLGKSALAANVDSVLYTVPANVVATLSLNLCNRTTSDIRVRVWIGTGTTDDSVIEYDAMIPPNGVLERTGLVASAGEKVTIRAVEKAGMSARVMGFEEPETYAR